MKISFEYVLKTSYEMSSRYLQDVLQTFWKTKNYYAEDLWKTSSKRLEDQQMFARQLIFDLKQKVKHAKFEFKNITSGKIHLSTLVYGGRWFTIKGKLINCKSTSSLYQRPWLHHASSDIFQNTKSASLTFKIKWNKIDISSLISYTSGIFLLYLIFLSFSKTFVLRKL